MQPDVQALRYLFEQLHGLVFGEVLPGHEDLLGLRDDITGSQGLLQAKGLLHLLVRFGSGHGDGGVGGEDLSDLEGLVVEGTDLPGVEVERTHGVALGEKP